MLEEDSHKKDFHGLGIVPAMLERITEMGFVTPTPIQYKAIPVATAGEDVVGIAQTGSGKTLAFSIPMIQIVVAKKKMGLILLPTRELAIQVEETLNSIAGPYGLRTAILIGGINAGPQIKQLKANPHIVVATPGRLLDHIEQKNVSLSNVGMLVLDEADRMLDMGFAPQLNKILSFVPADRQTMLFSATMPDKITEIAHKYMKEPLRIEVAPPGTTADNIDQEMFIVPKEEKLNLLKRLLDEHKGTVLVFSRTKHGAKKIADKIRQMGYSADEIHSNRSQSQRQSALRGFSTGKYRILVATDIAARGLDVDDIELVINFDLPSQIEDYTHRIGRTGRAGRSGKAVSFAVPEQKDDIVQIQKLINLILPIKSPSGELLESIKDSGSHKGSGKSVPNNPKSAGGRSNNSRNRRRPSRRRA
ncbi:MAG: DEAD/DEAH box helicase [Chlamydiota bacterium]|nr:DEAD/DEAH box helicase [Chlamydiota bacterium]